MKNTLKSTDTETRKALNYDLDSKKVKKYYKGKNNAWSDIKKYLKKRNFDSRQYSGVASNIPISAADSIFEIEELNKTFPWLRKCVQKFDMTSIENDYDLNYIFKKRKNKNNKLKNIK